MSNPAMSTEALDQISAMRFGMESALQDLKWREETASIPGETCYFSPGDEVQFTMSIYGTHWAFAYDPLEGDDAVYNTFAEGDTWIEFERALKTAQAMEAASEGEPCPHCGECGGEPRIVTSREFQGEEGHGGWVTWEDEKCSLCI